MGKLHLTAAEKQEMTRLRTQGLTYREIGQRVCLTERMVHRILEVRGYAETLLDVTLIRMRREREDLRRRERAERRRRTRTRREPRVALAEPAVEVQP